jgi:hypothetical protein
LRTFHAAVAYSVSCENGFQVNFGIHETSAIVDDMQWVGLDARTGRLLARPIDFGFTPLRQVQYADLDGGGEPEILALGSGAKAGQETLAALSCRSGRQKWTAAVNASFEPLSNLGSGPDWPLIIDDDGDGRSERGAAVQPGLAVNDPRWTRPLPWTTGRLSTLALRGFLFFAGLALINVGSPLAILRLAARRRPWTMRVLMALPVAAAVPLTALIALTPTLEGRFDPWVAYAKLEFLLATLAGIPLVAFALAACLDLARRQWKSLSRLTTLTLLASIVIAAGWLLYDMKSMPAIEHYGASGSYFALVPSAFGAGVLLVIARLVRSAIRIKS